MGDSPTDFASSPLFRWLRLVYHWSCKDVSPAWFQGSRNLLERTVQVKNMFAHILSNHQIESGVGKGLILQVLAQVSLRAGLATWYGRVVLGSQVTWSGGQLDGSASGNWRRLVNYEAPPIRVELFRHEHESTFAGNGATGTAQKMVAEPVILRRKQNVLLADATVSRMLEIEILRHA